MLSHFMLTEKKTLLSLLINDLYKVQIFFFQKFLSKKNIIRNKK